MFAPAVVSVMVTFWAEVKVPPAGLMMGVAAEVSGVAVWLEPLPLQALSVRPRRRALSEAKQVRRKTLITITSTPQRRPERGRDGVGLRKHTPGGLGGLSIGRVRKCPLIETLAN